MWHNVNSTHNPPPIELSFNERLVIIADIFKKLKLLNVSDNKKHLYYNDTFDSLYELDGANLMRYDTYLRDQAIEKFGVIQL